MNMPSREAEEMTDDKLYLACVADRHVDPVFRLFANPNEAMAWALDEFVDTVAHPDNIAAFGSIGDNLAYWSYGEESDCAWVQAIEKPKP